MAYQCAAIQDKSWHIMQHGRSRDDGQQGSHQGNHVGQRGRDGGSRRIRRRRHVGNRRGRVGQAGPSPAAIVQLHGVERRIIVASGGNRETKRQQAEDGQTDVNAEYNAGKNLLTDQGPGQGNQDTIILHKCTLI
ncbi:hypothetical protein E2562_006951 [Oryza meyeriana var. granulata]|uniref:Uncharacterized protein n=1 Tax=Oryza meyeriana var. granulata TaxID=110450 RepID=A0A6G1E9C5_9ORYZ|nr:hypothetical protein E2562_006951 [Oryza meyeriana var. granulata]